ncbi:alternate-type signal peptide domain-containing protein [Cellulomonas sp. Root137]|uniref:alternate-type signal peptide domain-containing protein n=1 Tax=Cellulomonas sp. Root137 TaxID=1736459 RepID=UPI000AEDC164|nr:alternate-type signal peptide domain-containing protein [Cellulomonas sp. Root137]
MRKTTKGAIAVGAGVALLLGGAGTMAAWKTGTAVAAGSSISSGSLTIVPKVGALTPVWAWNSGAGTFDATNSRIVPGDVVKRTQVFTVTARGDRLKFTADLDLAPVISGDANLTAALTAATTLSATAPAGATITGSPGSVLTVTPGTGSADVTFDVTVTSIVTWNFGTAGSDAATTMGKSVSLAGATLNLTQVTFP